MTIRLQKILARAGYGSRRACETLIREGRVTVNGRMAVLGESADEETAVIRVDGEVVHLPAKPIYIMANKPRGVVSTTKAQAGQTAITDWVQVDRRVFPVGRLDVESEGMILLTDDGALAQRIQHPRYGHEKEYRVLLNHRPSDEHLRAWRKGVILEDGFVTAPAAVRREGGSAGSKWIRVVLTQGHKRQIRLTARALGLHVRRLIRVRIGGLEIGNLGAGDWRYLTAQEVDLLRKPSRSWGQKRRSRAPARRGG